MDVSGSKELHLLFVHIDTVTVYVSSPVRFHVKNVEDTYIYYPEESDYIHLILS